MEYYKHVVSPVLDRLDSEKMHVAVRDGLHRIEQYDEGLDLLEQIFVPGGERIWDERLNVQLGETVIDNPFIVGAGWDKNGVAVRALHKIGAGAVEVGAVLRHPQPGNEKPRQWMIAPGVSINALGFNSLGIDAVNLNLVEYDEDNIPILGNVGFNKDFPHSQAAEDYSYVAGRLAMRGVRGIVLCFSSPNTKNLRALQTSSFAGEVVMASQEAIEKAGSDAFLLVKIDPDMDDESVDYVIQTVLDNNADGIVATNTTSDQELKNSYPKGVGKPGGLAGDNPIFRRKSTRRVAYVRRGLGPDKIVLGVGGVKDASTGLEKILAGANAFEAVTSLRGEGFSVFYKTNRGILNWMDRQGVKNISELVGLEAHKY